MNSKLFYLLLLITLSLELRVKIFDKQYVYVRVGYTSGRLKFLIDPTAPFSMLFAEVNSKSAVKGESFKYTDMFGTVEGNWETDSIFITPDEIFNFKLKYLKVTKKESLIDRVDGILGLGYSSTYPDCNIYKILQTMSNVLINTEPFMTFDRKRQILTIGKFPGPEYTNPQVYPLKEDPVYGTLINITAIGVTDSKKNMTRIELNDTAKLGLIPVLVAPEKRKNDLLQKYFTLISEGKVEEDTSKKFKFFNDVHVEKKKKMKTEILLGNIAYKYDALYDYEGQHKSSIRFGDRKEDKFSVWYLGMDEMKIDRADFDYTNNCVKLYSASARDINKFKLLLLAYFALISALFVFCCACFLRCCCFRKEQKDIKKGEELVDL